MPPSGDTHAIEQTPLGAAWRFRWVVLFLTILGGGLAFTAGATIATTRYEATASLVVTDPRTSTLFSTDEAARNAALYVNDQIAILGSDSVAQRTSELLESQGLSVDATTLTKTLRVLTTQGNEILIRYKAADDVTAIGTVNAVIEAYGQIRGEEAARDSASAIEQLNQSIADIDVELRGIEDDILNVRDSSVQEQLDQQYEEALARLVEIQPQLATATGRDLDDLRLELADIDQQLARLESVSSIEEDSPRLTQLYGEQAEAISRRSNLAQQRDQLLVDTELLSGGISLSSPAQFARELHTAVPAITILGAFVGLLAGGGLAYYLAMRRREFGQRDQPGWVLRTPLLAEIPIFGEEGLSGELPVLEHPASASAEAFRFAATALEHRPGGDRHAADLDTPEPHTFLITSPGPKEGKTVLAANLALAAARKGHRVLALDADFGNQRLSELLRGDRERGPGMTEIVETGLELSSGTFSLGPPGPLVLISRGNQPTTAPDFFSLPATRAFIAEIGKRYDLVVIDGPPMLHVAYASNLAMCVDRVVVVTRHGGSVSRLGDMAQRLDLIGTPLAGYVYNGAPLRYEMTLTGGSLRDVLGQDTGNRSGG